MDAFLGSLLDDVPWDDVAALDNLKQGASGHGDDGPRDSSAEPDVDDLDLDALSDVDWQGLDVAEDLLHDAASRSPHSSHPTPPGPGTDALPWQQQQQQRASLSAAASAYTDAGADNETLAVQPYSRTAVQRPRAPLPGQPGPANLPPLLLTHDSRQPANCTVPAAASTPSSACSLLHPSPASLASSSPPAAAASTLLPPSVAGTPEAPVQPASATSAAAAAAAASSSAFLGGRGAGTYSSSCGEGHLAAPQQPLPRSAGSHSVSADHSSQRTQPAAAAGTVPAPFLPLPQPSGCRGIDGDRDANGPGHPAVSAAAAAGAAAAEAAEAQRQHDERRQLSRAAAAVAAAASLGLPPPDLVALGLLPPGHRYHTSAAAAGRQWDSRPPSRSAGSLAPSPLAQAHPAPLGGGGATAAAASGASPAQPPPMLRRYTSSSTLQPPSATYHPYQRPRERSGPAAGAANSSLSSASALHGSCPVLSAASPASSSAARPRSPRSIERSRSNLYGGGAGPQAVQAAISEVLSYNGDSVPYDDALFDDLMSVGSDELELCGMDVDVDLPQGGGMAAPGAGANASAPWTAAAPPLAAGAHTAPRHSSNGGARRDGSVGGLAGSPADHMSVGVDDSEADMRELRELLCSRSSGGGGAGYNGGGPGPAPPGFGLPPHAKDGAVVQRAWSVPTRTTAAAATPYIAGGGALHAFQSLQLPGTQPHAAPAGMAPSGGSSGGGGGLAHRASTAARCPAHAPAAAATGHDCGNSYSSAPSWAPPAQQQQQLPSAASGPRPPCMCAECRTAATAAAGSSSGGGGVLPPSFSAPCQPPHQLPPPQQQPARCMLPCCNPTAPPTWAARPTCQLPCCVGPRAPGAAPQQCRPTSRPRGVSGTASAPGYPTSQQLPPCARTSTQPYYPHSQPATPVPPPPAPQYDSMAPSVGGYPSAQPYLGHAAPAAGSAPTHAAPAAPAPHPGAASQFPALSSQQQSQAQPGAYGGRQLPAGPTTAYGRGLAAGQFPSRGTHGGAAAPSRYGALPLPGAAQAAAPAQASYWPLYAPPPPQQQPLQGNGVSSQLPQPQGPYTQMQQQQQPLYQQQQQQQQGPYAQPFYQ